MGFFVRIRSVSVSMPLFDAIRIIVPQTLLLQHAICVAPCMRQTKPSVFESSPLDGELYCTLWEGDDDSVSYCSCASTT